jgi:hypothetical protein
MTQLSLPMPLDVDPRLQMAACRKLQRLVDERRRSFENRDYVKRRKAALSFYRRGV